MKTFRLIKKDGTILAYIYGDQYSQGADEKIYILLNDNIVSILEGDVVKEAIGKVFIYNIYID